MSDLIPLMHDADLAAEKDAWVADTRRAIDETFGQDAERPVEVDGDGYDREAS